MLGRDPAAGPDATEPTTRGQFSGESPWPTTTGPTMGQLLGGAGGILWPTATRPAAKERLLGGFLDGAQWQDLMKNNKEPTTLGKRVLQSLMLLSELGWWGEPSN